MLKYKRQHDAEDGKELLVHQQTKNCAGKSQGRSAHLQTALDVTFILELFDLTRNVRIAKSGRPDNPAF